MTWQADKQWADKFLPEIERVVRSLAGQIISVRVAEPDEDQHHATDYVVTVSSGDIACRVRAWHYWQRFNDLTFRYSRPSGQSTEVEKIQQGFARWYLYAWARGDSSFGAWAFLDLDKVREQEVLDGDWPVIWNKDYSSSFIAVPLSQFGQLDCIVDTGGEAEHQLAQLQLL